MTTRPVPSTPLTARRKPRQSRAHHTALALREAFVRLLVKRDYASITIRQITTVAGTGLGSFYEYYADKDDLARVCIHLRSKALLLTMRAAVPAHAGCSLAEVVAGVVGALTEAHRAQPLEWTEHYMLERHVSSPATYRVMYERFVAEWVAALATAVDLPASCALREAAVLSQTIVYGLFSHALIQGGSAPNLELLASQTRTAIVACVRAVC